MVIVVHLRINICFELVPHVSFFLLGFFLFIRRDGLLVSQV